MEMLSARALIYNSQRTLQMAKRHSSEEVLGVQVTGGSADDTAKAVAILEKMDFDTIDINMGCPVQKVVKSGSGSAILKEPSRVYETIKRCREETDKPLSAKIRIGWDHQSINALEVVDAIEKGGADWLTVHGRTRSDDYSVPVDLTMIRKIKDSVSIPVIGNGNIFQSQDSESMLVKTMVDGVMVSRGALGNPWVFKELKNQSSKVSVDDWSEVIIKHLDWQKEEYGPRGRGAVCMRKHLLWYLKGWHGAKKWKEIFGKIEDLEEAKSLILACSEEFKVNDYSERSAVEAQSSFSWDPKWQMDRQLDRGVGHELLQ